MFIDPRTMTVAHVQLAEQMAELQAMGYLPAVGVDFDRVRDSLLESGFSFMRRSDGQESRWLTIDPYVRMASVLKGVWTFEPRHDPDFTPRQIIMVKENRCLPMIVEKTSFDQAKEVSDAAGRKEIEKYKLLERHPDMETSAFLLRSWDGVVHAMCLGAVTCYNAGQTFMCFRDVKFDRKKKTKVRDVGPVLTLARLLYMRNRGLWSDAAPILSDIRPEILAGYRARLPRVPSGIVRDESSISRAEADYLLASSPYNLVPLPSSPAPAVLS